MFPWLSGLFKGKADEIVKTTFEGLDNMFTSKEEKMAFELKKSEQINKHLESIMNDTTKQLELVLADRQSAREMFKINSSLQKVYALSFLFAYIILAFGTIYLLVANAAKVPDNVQVLIASTFGAMSVKVSTITDFLFGSGIDNSKKP